MGSLRLNLDNKQDQEFLRKRKGSNGRSLLDELLQDRVTYGRVLKKLPDCVEVPGIDKIKGKSKYRNNCFWQDGVYWRSSWEYDCYLKLQTLEKCKTIFDLKTQVPFSLDVNGVHVGKAILDFTFIKNGITYVYDAKHRETAKQVKWRYQVKLMKAIYGIEVRIFYYKETDVMLEVINL